MSRSGKTKKNRKINLSPFSPRQVLISTHSEDLLRDKGIDGREVLLLTPDSEGTKVEIATKIKDARALLDAGLPISDAVLPRTRPGNVEQLGLFE